MTSSWSLSLQQIFCFKIWKNRTTCVRRPGYRNRYSDSLQVRPLRISKPDVEEIFHARPDLLWSPTSLLCNGHRIFSPWVKRGVKHPRASSAEVKEIIVVYGYSPTVPSRPIIGWNLPLRLQHLRTNHRWDGDIIGSLKMDFEIVAWINLAQDGSRWKDVVKSVKNLASIKNTELLGYMKDC